MKCSKLLVHFFHLIIRLFRRGRKSQWVDVVSFVLSFFPSVARRSSTTTYVYKINRARTYPRSAVGRVPAHTKTWRMTHKLVVRTDVYTTYNSLQWHHSCKLHTKGSHGGRTIKVIKRNEVLLWIINSFQNKNLSRIIDITT